MLSKSNVFILLILIKHSALFDFTLANSIAANVHAQFDDTKTTVETVTSTLSHVGHSNGNTVTDTRQITAIKATTTKDPLVTGNRKQFEGSIENRTPVRTTSPTKISTIEVNGANEWNANDASARSVLMPETVSRTLASTSASPFNAKPMADSTQPSTSQQFNRGNVEINSDASHSASAQNSSLMDKRNNNSNNQIIEDNSNIKSLDYVNDRNDDKTDYVKLPQSDAASSDTDHSSENIKSRPDAVYFVIAVIGGARIWARPLAQTLNDMGPPFSGDLLGSPLRPIYVDLPTNGRFSVNVLLSLCQQSEKRPLAGVVVIGNGQSAHAVAYAGSAMQLPVLWAKGGTSDLRELHPEASVQALLQPSAIEIFEAVRSLFLQTHWHSFFVLSDVQATNVMNVKDNPLKRAPLVPTIVPLPRNNDDVFKQLAQISRSTRGVILLLTNLQATRRIMTEAHRLNMVGGHFIWLWIDTSSSTGYIHPASTPPQSTVRQQQKMQSPNRGSNNDGKAWANTDFTENLKSADKASTVKPNAPKANNQKKPQLETDADLSSIEQLRPMKNEHPANGDEQSSEGFDPFRVMQRQDEQPKTSFNTPQHYQDRITQRDNQQTVSNRLILGLRGENGSEAKNIKHPKESNTRSEKTRRSSAQDYMDESAANDANHNGSGNADGIPFSGNHDLPIFISNHSNMAKNAISSKYRNFSDDNLDEFIDNNNFNENHNLKLNLKRTSSANGNSSSYVHFHQFKDFPVGLLALRPIRMNVDRHFIRAAVRIFAATWDKINAGKSIVNGSPRPGSTTTPQSRRIQQNRAHAAIQFNAKKATNELHGRKQRRKRNIFSANQLLVQTMPLQPNRSAQTAMDGQYRQHQSVVATMQVNSSRFLNETNLKNDSDTHTNSANVSGLSDSQMRNHMMQSMQFNSSFTSDLPSNKDKYYNNRSDSLVNVSFNRNFSGLWKQNSKHKSNIHSLNNTQHQAIKTLTSDDETVAAIKVLNATNQSAVQFNHIDSTVESMARQASQSVVNNFFDGRWQDTRYPFNKRQSRTWWSTKQDGVQSMAQNKRPQYDGNNKNGHQLTGKHHSDDDPKQIKSETPSYFGGCYGTSSKQDVKNAEQFSRALRDATKLALSGRPIYNGISENALSTNFELLNLVPGDHPYHSKMNGNQTVTGKATSQGAQRRDKRSPPANANAANITSNKWRRVGLVSASSVRLDTIVWPGGDIVVSGLSAGARTVFRIVTALAPPFVMESELDEDGLCLRGLPCHRVSPVGQHNLTLMFNAIETRERLEEDAVEHGNDLPPEPEHLDEKISHVTKCCYGLTMDLLDNIATELEFEFHLYVVRDQLFGAKHQRDVKDFIKISPKSTPSNDATSQPAASDRSGDETFNADQWNGIIGDLVSGSADMSFAPLSVSKARAQAIDFSIPYFHSGVSLLASPKKKSEIPLLAFLLPFSPELWIAIFTSLNITAVAVAVYEWLSPFGLNPWGRQRSKNFSLSSALWVMWGLLCGHLVAFKAPKSWPNKFLINVWGGFSVIFVASYTANIAALIAGLFFHHAASSYHSSLTTQRVGAPIASAAESYVQNKDKHLWEHMKKYSLNHIEDGIRGLKNGTLDLLMADSPILDYYRATDHGCSLQRIGETFVEDTYAIGMVKGFPLRESISALIAKYSSNGYLDILTEKWYGGLPCFKYEAEIVAPKPLGVAAVAGVFLLLGLGMVMGVVILIFEHWFYKYALPSLRLKPKGTIWKSRNIMFFSQKLYRFINCVELVSPHHAARELVHSIRQGQISSLFQKSIKRKEDEQRRRRKSKAQFFEMIQEIRRAQQVERQNLAVVAETETYKDVKSPPSLFKPRASPKPSIFSALKKDGRSRSNSSVLTPRRYSTDSILGDRMDSIGRRLSRDLTNSPPDMSRRYEYGKCDLSPNKYDTISGSTLASLGISKSNEALTNRYDTFSGKQLDVIPATVKTKKAGKRPKISFESYHRDEYDNIGKVECEYELPSVKEGLEPSFLQKDRSAAILRHKMHTELRSKHPPVPSKPVVTIVEQKPNSVDRPPLPKKGGKHQRQKSLDNLDVQNDAADKKGSPYKSDSSASSLTRSMNQRSQISLERLSREDLLRLSHSSQSEIHEYLKGSRMPDRAAEPP